jgi:hypothetical protein
MEDQEKVKINGPGLGAAKKSYIKFINLDVNNTEYFGIDIDRQEDEAFCNAFDMRHTKNVQERNDRQIKNRQLQKARPFKSDLQDLNDLLSTSFDS